MGSPLSPVAACLYMECLEEDRYRNIMGPGCTWIRYVDDVLIVFPEDVNLQEKVEALNEVDPKIQFTVEMENGGMIPFLDTLVIRSGSNAKFKVYRKPTNKEDYVHFLSGHNDRVKSGIVIGFFLRAYRICSEEFLEEEVDHIYNSFMKLQYPKGYVIRIKKKAEEIRRRSNEEKRKRQQELKQRGRFISIPNSKHANEIATSLQASGINVAIVSGFKVRDLACSKIATTASNSVIYRIPCSGPCSKSYVGETGRGLKTRLQEHRRDVRNHNVSNAMVLHLEHCQNLSAWDKATVIEANLSKPIRKAMEAAYIMMEDTMNVKPGFYTWSRHSAKIAMKKRK